MIQRARRNRFLGEAAMAIGIAEGRVRQDLEGNLALQPDVASPIDLAHSARTERTENLVRTEMRRRAH